MAKKKKKKSTIRTRNFLNMLKQVHLNGILEECILKVKKGKGKIEAVDMTNSLIVISKNSIMSKDVTTTLGLGNLELLIKFLSTLEEDKVIFNEKKKDDYKFFIQRADSRRKLEYLLTGTDLIATKLETEKKGRSTYKKMTEMMDYNVELTSTFIKDFLSYISLLKTKNVLMKYNPKKEKISFVCGSSNEHRFRLTLSNSVEGNEEDKGFNIKINGEYLSRIFSVIDFNEDEPPKLSFADEKPIMVEDGKTAWALIPIEELEEEPDDIPF